MSQSPPPTSSWLVPLPGGPALEPLQIAALPEGVVIGRHEQCQVRLPADADKVSRFHARFSADAGQWRITDLKSRWGTLVNGLGLTPHRPMPIADGDLIGIVPWTFHFSTGAVPRGLQSFDDTGTMTSMIRGHGQTQPAPLHDEMLKLLLEGSSRLHAAQGETDLATILMDMGCRGTGLPNAAVLRPLDAAGTIEVVARRLAPGQLPDSRPAYSRSLLARASSGEVAELGASVDAPISESILQMRIDAALCAPLRIGPTVAAYLYLDSRGGSAPHRPRPNAAGFCLALADMASLALANLKRVEMERRAAGLEAELRAAAEAQKWIFPKGQIECGPFRCSGDSHAGQYLGGDFFDALPLPSSRLAVALGDVSGHGVAASVLMTACQGFLHAALSQHGDVARAVTDLNRFVYPRRPMSKFVTLWVGIFDPRQQTLSYVDAGHGYALLIHPDNRTEPLAGGSGLPVGVMDDSIYQATTRPLPAAARALILSDGIIEQFEAQTPPDRPRRMFEMRGVQSAIAAGTGDFIGSLFQAVHTFAGTTSLSDDATAVMVRW